MGALEDRLEYILETNSQSEVSRQTGIPQSTISYVASGQRSLPTKYDRQLRNMYQREAYKNIYDIIPNSTNANRYKWYAPSTVRSVQKELQEITDYLTEGAIGAHFSNLGRDASMDEIETAWPAMHEAVVRGMAASPYSLDEWRDYGHR